MNNEVNCLWGKIRGGDEKAFDSLFKKLYPFLCSFAQKILNDLPEAEETVQDAFIILWQNKEKITINDSLKSYLYQTVHNLAINKINHFKTNKFQPNTRKSQEQWKQIQEMYFVDNIIIQKLEASETENLIARAVEKLPERCREIFELSRYDQLSYEEISDKLHLSQNTVRAQIFKAISIIHQIIEK